MDEFWQRVKVQAFADGAAITMAAVVGGMVYIVYTVPSMLREVIENQKTIITRQNDNRRIIDSHSERIVRLEALTNIKR